MRPRSNAIILSCSIAMRETAPDTRRYRCEDVERLDRNGVTYGQSLDHFESAGWSWLSVVCAGLWGICGFKWNIHR